MPSPERPGGEPRREHEQPPFHLASQYRNERPALKAYARAQEALYKAPTADLSTYRLLVPALTTWFVAVLGERPDELLERRLRSILSSGEPATLPPDILHALGARRQENTRLGGWVERHYPPPEPR